MKKHKRAANVVDRPFQDLARTLNEVFATRLRPISVQTQALSLMQALNDAYVKAVKDIRTQPSLSPREKEAVNPGVNPLKPVTTRAD